MPKQPQSTKKPKPGGHKRTLIIIVVLAVVVLPVLGLLAIITMSAFYTLGVFSPQSYLAPAVTGFTGLGKPVDWMYRHGGEFAILLKNNLPSTVIIEEVTVSCVSDVSLTSVGSQSIPSGGTVEYKTSECDLDAGEGDPYAFDVDVKYRMEGSSMTKTDTGKVAGTVS